MTDQYQTIAKRIMRYLSVETCLGDIMVEFDGKANQTIEDDIAAIIRYGGTYE